MSPSQTIFVTGAHGFLGRHIARALAGRGFTVFGIGHGQWSFPEWSQWGLAAWLEADITAARLRRFEVAPAMVVHCAGSGSVRYAEQHPLSDYERTVTTTQQVLEFLRTDAPGAGIVIPSSASVYGNCILSPIPESAPLSPISQYGVHKLLAEQLVQSWALRYRIPAAIVRLFSVYGPGLRKQLLWDACGKLASGNPAFMGTGDEVRDWIHVEDAAELLVEAMAHVRTGCPIVNGGSGEGVCVRELLQHLAAALLQEPAAVSFTQRVRAGDPTSYIADVCAARAWLWQPRQHWRRGVSEYAAWWCGEARAEHCRSARAAAWLLERKQQLSPGSEGAAWRFERR